MALKKTTQTMLKSSRNLRSHPGLSKQKGATWLGAQRGTLAKKLRSMTKQQRRKLYLQKMSTREAASLDK